MRTKLLLLAIVLFLGIGCRKNSEPNPDLAKQYSYQELKRALYDQEKQMKGLVTIDYRYWKPPLTKAIKLRVHFTNHAVVTPYKDFHLAIKFVAPSGTVLKQLDTVIYIIVTPQHVEQQVLALRSYPEQTSQVIVNLVDYKPVAADSIPLLRE